MNLRDRFRSAAQNAGVYFSRAVSAEDIRKFISLLRPQHAQETLIRIGAEDDGGYLVPNDLEGIRACVSPGVDHTARFEEDLARRGIPSFLCDYSVDGPPEYLRDYTFDKKFLGIWDDEIYLTFARWFEKYNLLSEPGDLILQMDIEGSEWLALASLDDETLRRFRYILIELHAVSDVVNPICYKLYSQVLQKLGRHFSVAHLHANNHSGSVTYKGMEIPRVLEVTYVRNDRLVRHKGALQFPHPLDRPCRAHVPEMVLPEVWWAS
jgi:hypothetical protein